MVTIDFHTAPEENLSMTSKELQSPMNHSTARVLLDHLEINVVYACNLKCEYCTHLGSVMKGHVPLEELVRGYETWNHKIAPALIRVMGGEPLLHPQIELVLYATSRCWPGSKIVLITNGILLHQAQPEFWDAVKETHCIVQVSHHFNHDAYNRKTEEAITILQAKGIPYCHVLSYHSWSKSYRIGNTGAPRPFKSDPAAAWTLCDVKHSCTTLLDNHLYRCPQLACISHACRKGYVPEEWKTVLDYRPLSPESTYEEIRAFMNDGACPQCSICPEQFEYAEMTEKLNPLVIPHLKETEYL